ncbi:FAD-dependent oxidoreductase [Rhodophyticola porphyridii]|uniref:Tryptophan 2-monooxygenase n=1 Tax=Rhodophyticola porphyridii TaxID=1852017 RepID=A0A3L9Y901_9RHOB|nr:FAD-dependent oxidoreductase [Rhodophyticola porphyridii]
MWLNYLFSMDFHDVVIVGAGAAGIGAGLELAGTGLNFVVLEAADRVGGRALTDTSGLPVAWDHGCHWLHSADINPLVAWADRLGAAYRTEDRVDHFAIWQAGRFVSATELAEARAATLAAFDAIEAAFEAENDVSIQEILPDAGRWNAGVRCVLQTMAGANPEKVSAPDYFDGEDTDLNWPVISGYGDIFFADGLQPSDQTECAGRKGAARGGLGHARYVRRHDIGKGRDHHRLDRRSGLGFDRLLARIHDRTARHHWRPALRQVRKSGPCGDRPPSGDRREDLLYD